MIDTDHVRYGLKKEEEDHLTGSVFTTLIQQYERDRSLDLLSGASWFARWARQLLYSSKGPKSELFRAFRPSLTSAYASSQAGE
jgi:hypothetical protein